MRRLDVSVGLAPKPADVVGFRARTSGRAPSSTAVRTAAAMAAMIAIVVMSVFMASRVRHAAPNAREAAKQPAVTNANSNPAQTPEKALREVSAEHLERSKLVVLGLATLNPAEARTADWQYERQLAGALLSDTRLYRRAAQDRGMNDMAHVMRDLETVLIETSMSDSSDRDALARVQKLIAKRDLVVKMQLVAAN